MFVTANQCQGHGNMLLLWYHLNKQNPFELKGHLQGANNRKHNDNEIKIWKVNQNCNAIWHNLHLRNFTCVYGWMGPASCWGFHRWVLSVSGQTWM